MKFNVKVKDGELFINNEFVEQLCWDNEAIGQAVVSWLNNN